MSKITEHEFYADNNMLKGTVVITIDGSEWDAFRKSAQMRAMREYVDKMGAIKEPEKQDAKEKDGAERHATYKELQEKTNELWGRMVEQLMCVGSRMDRRDKLLAVAMTVAVLALALAIHATVLLH